jgi:hypothetical protein
MKCARCRVNFFPRSEGDTDYVVFAVSGEFLGDTDYVVCTVLGVFIPLE